MVPIPRLQRWIVSGRRGVGKTLFCRRVAALARRAGWSVAGLLSLPRFADDRKVGIEALDLRSGESRPLATHKGVGSKGLLFGDWLFDPISLEWGNRVLTRALPCDLLVIDEIGPLEFELGAGWTAGLQVAAEQEYRVALVVVRPEYCPDYFQRWPGSCIVTISSPEQAGRWAERLFRLRTVAR